jgi:hypothetical protein
MKRDHVIGIVGVFALALPVRAGSLDLPGSFTSAQFASFSMAAADAITFPWLASAVPTGLSGFELVAAAGGPRVNSDSAWWHAIDNRLVAGVWPGQRLIARKGLPLRFDVGAQVGSLAGERFWGVEGRWALVDGGAVTPAIALRASYSQFANAPFQVAAQELQLGISKGFAILTPYGAIGYRRFDASARVGTPADVALSSTGSTTTWAAGVRLNVPVLRLVGEVRHAANLAFFLGVGVGL